MIFYIAFLLLITFLLLIQYFYQWKIKIFEYLTFTVLILVAGFREKIGVDYNSYVSWYFQKTRDSDFEFGFVAIMNLFRWLGLSPSHLFFFFSFFTCYFVILGIKNYTANSSIALLFYVLIPSLYLTSFSLVRQSFAVAVSFYAFYYLINKRYLFYFLLMFLGVSIHRSCLIPFFVFLFVFKFYDKFKTTHLLGLIIGSFILSRFDFIQIFRILFENNRYLYYFSNKEQQVELIKLIIINLEGIFILFYFQYVKEKRFYDKHLLIIYCFSIVFVNLCSKNSDSTRIATYFRIFEIIVLTKLIFLESGRKRSIIFLFFYALYFSAFLVGLKKDFDRQNINMPKFIPYKNILWSFLNENCNNAKNIN